MRSRANANSCTRFLLRSAVIVALACGSHRKEDSSREASGQPSASSPVAAPEPTEPTEPTEPAEPNPAEPDPAEPTEQKPAKPIEPKPAKPKQKPTEPIEPKPARPAHREPVKPAPAEATHRPEPAAPAAPSEPSEPDKPAHRAAEDELAAAYESLPEGAIAYPTRMTMKQGSSSPVVVRMGLTPKLSVDGIAGKPAVEPAKLSRFVVACLISGPEEFQLVATQGQPTDSAVCRESGCSCLRQTLVADEAEVSWLATPLQSGELKLYLRVAARLFLSGSKEEAHDVLSKEGIVHVDSDVWYVATGFLENSWKELLASVGGVGAIWALGKRLLTRRGEPRQAGFGRSQPAPPRSWVSKLRKSIRP